MKRHVIEKEKLRKGAMMSDGYGFGISVTHGIVEGISSTGAGSYELGYHGVVIPWGNSQHIKVVVTKE